MAKEIDWDELETQALEMFTSAAARTKSHGYGPSVKNESARAAADLLQAIAAMRGQRLAEEQANKEESIQPKSIKSAPRHS